LCQKALRLAFCRLELKSGNSRFPFAEGFAQYARSSRLLARNRHYELLLPDFHGELSMFDTNGTLRENRLRAFFRLTDRDWRPNWRLSQATGS
jgi:hypothetical protein